MSKAASPLQRPPFDQPVVEGVVATPRGASEFDEAVDATKKASVAIIVIHIVALAAFGFYFWSQIVVTVFALVVSGVVIRRRFEKCAYTASAALFSLGFVADGLRVVEWWLDLDYLNSSTNDSAGDVGVGWAILFSVPCILGAVLFLVGAACARKAIRKWEQSGIMLPIE